MKRWLFLLFFAFILGPGASVAATEPTVSVVHFSREFPQRVVNAFAQDQQGFIWFGTWSGLCRYDGHEFRYFKSDGDSDVLLSTHRINNLIVSSENNIWGITNNGECFLFGAETEQFRYPLAGFESDDGSQLRTDWVYTFPNGITWIACRGYAVRVDERVWGDGSDAVDNGISIYKIGERIKNIRIDTEGVVWLLTDRTIHVFGGEKQTEGVTAVSICSTADAMWLAEQDGALFCYTVGRSVPQQYHVPSSYGAVQTLVALADDTIGICTEDGFAIYHAAEHVFQFVPLQGGNINRCYKDSHGRLWLFTDYEGVYQYDPERDRLLHLQGKSGEQWGQRNTHFWYENKEGVIFLVPRNGGLCFFNEELEELQLLQTIDGRHYQSGTRRFLVDRQENIWCAEAEGVSCISVQTQYIRNTVLPQSRETRSLLADRSGRLWVGTRDRVVRLFDADYRQIGYLHPDGRIRSERAELEAPVYCMHEDSNGVIWMGTRLGGLLRLTPIGAAQYRIDRFRHLPSDASSISDDNVYDICRDRKGRLWIGTYGGGLNLVEEDAALHPRFIHSRSGLSYPQETFGQIRVLQEADGHLLVGTTAGLLLFRTDFERCDSICFHPVTIYSEPPSRLPTNDVRDIHRDSSGRLWVLTFSGGLSRLQMSDDAHGNSNRDGRGGGGGYFVDLENFTKQNGIPSDLVCFMIEDLAGNQWILSEKQAFRFDPLTSRFESLGAYLTGQDFYFSEARPILYGDAILAGTTNGYAALPTQTTHTGGYTPPIVLTELRIDGQTVNQGISNLETLHLKADERDLQLSFTALDFKNPQALHYAWRLEGVDREWRTLGNTRSINLIDLDAGSYELLIRSTDSEGAWADNIRRLRIEVAPTFWETGWANLLYAVLMLLAALILAYMLHLRERIRMEQALTEIKLRFYTDISHELRTPLTLITAPVDLLLRREKLTETGHEQLMSIRRNTQRLIHLVNQILDFRKIENKKMRLVLEAGDLSEVIRRTMAHFDQLADEHHIDYTFVCEAEPLRGWVDRDKLEKILFNLLSNAFKYTADGKQITVTAECRDEKVAIRVIDEGIGMDETVRNRIFRRFETITQFNLFKPSSGIGLSLVHELVLLHGGMIDVESTPGVGSCFTVVLPIARKAFEVLPHADFLLGGDAVDLPSEESDRPLLSMNDDAPAGRLRILLVEDNGELRHLLRDLLAETYTVFEAANGEEGLEAARRLQPDLIVSDVVMPRMDGLEMVCQIKSDPMTSHQLIILLSSRAALDDRIHGLEIGVDDYLPKPFHASYLLTRVRSLLERRRELQQRILIQMSEQEQQVESVELQFAKQALEIVKSHLDDSEWDVPLFAEAMHLSQRVFFQKLKSATGLSPVEFIREVRLSHAERLIREGHYDIATVSYMVGFSDPKYFTRIFKARFGVPPSQYIKTSS